MSAEAILVTGATGFLGGRLAETLLDRGQPVIACGRDGAKLSRLRNRGADILQCDLRDERGLAPLASLAPVRSVVHAAALSSPWGRTSEFLAANVTATENLVRAAQKSGTERFVFISSSSVYFSFRDQLAITEAEPLPRPVNAYAWSKQEAEQIVLSASGIGPVVLRPRAIHGAGDTALLPRLLRAVERHPLPLLRQGAAMSDLTHVDDAVAAIMAALDAGSSIDRHVFNISSGDPRPIREIVETACALSGQPPPRWRAMPLRPLMAVAGMLEAVHSAWPGRPEPSVTRYTLGLFAFSQTLDIAKAGHRLGWHPQIPFLEGMRRTFLPGGGCDNAAARQ